MAEKLTNGGPAHADPAGASAWNASHGMSLRDYFKTRALIAIVPVASDPETIAKIESMVSDYAKLAGELADAMIAETINFYQNNPQ